MVNRFAVCIDDTRVILDQEDLEVQNFTSCGEGLAHLCEYMYNYYNFSLPRLSELWLDHDLGPQTTIKPIWHFLMMVAFLGTPFPVDKIYLHSSNIEARDKMYADLRTYYTAEVIDVINAVLAERMQAVDM